MKGPEGGGLRRGSRIVGVLLLSCAVLLGIVVAFDGAGAQSPVARRAPRFCAINGIAVSGSHVWLSGCAFSTRSAFSNRIPAVIELNASDGSLVRVIKDRDAGNDGPAGIAASGSRVWVANGDGNSVLEINARTGAVVRYLKTKLDRFSSPWDIAASGSNVWVLNAGTFSITELNAHSGSRVRYINAKADDIPEVGSIIAIGARVWLTNGSYSANSVVELNANNGSLIRVIRSRIDGFNEPAGLAVEGSHVWVTSDDGPKATVPLADSDPNYPGGSVTELNASNGSFVRKVNTKQDKFLGSEGIAIGRSRVWVTNGNEGVVTELNEKTGALVRLIDAKADRFGGSSDIDLIGRDVWVVNAAVQIGGSCCDVWGSSITVLNVNNGSLFKFIN